jgi:hypothetical protein
VLELGRYGGTFLGCVSLFIAGRWTLMPLMHRWEIGEGAFCDMGNILLRLSATDPALLLQRTTSSLGMVFEEKLC